jgi:GntR family transcriptional regulator
MTTRQAITDLVNEGVFYREQGRGTFVTRNKITQQLIRLTGFTEDISARGQHPSTKTLSAVMAPADELSAERLRVAVGTPIFCLQRLRLADGEPLAIEFSHLNFKGCERLLEEDLEHQSLYRVLESKFGLPLMEADQELEAGLAGADEAALLKIAPGSAVLFTRRITYVDRNQPIEYAKSVYCGAKYTFYTHLRREQLFS